MKTLLVTGATGFVGRNFLLASGSKWEKILVPVRNPEKLKKQLAKEGLRQFPENWHVFRGDADDWNVAPQGAVVDAFLHCAGALFESSPEAYRKTNVEGTLRLLRNLPETARGVILSSQAAAGPCPPGVVKSTERLSLSPVTYYGISKREMEEEVSKAFPQRPYLFLRPPIVLGPRDQATLPLFRLAKGLILLKPGLRPKHYSFIDVRDLVRAIDSALAGSLSPRGPKGYFVSHRTSFEDRELLQGAVHALGKKKSPVVSIPHGVVRFLSVVVENIPMLKKTVPTLSRDRVKEILHDRWVVDPTAFEEAFAWRATVSLEQSLKDTAYWYRDEGLLRF